MVATSARPPLRALQRHSVDAGDGGARPTTTTTTRDVGVDDDDENVPPLVAADPKHHATRLSLAKPSTASSLA